MSSTSHMYCGVARVMILQGGGGEGGLLTLTHILMVVRTIYLQMMKTAQSKRSFVFDHLWGIPGDTGDREVAMLQDICSKQGQVSVWLLIGDTRRYGGQGGGHAAGHL